MRRLRLRRGATDAVIELQIHLSLPALAVVLFFVAFVIAAGVAWIESRDEEID